MEKLLETILSIKVIGPVITVIIMFIIYKILKRIIKKIFSFKTSKIKEKKQLTLMKFFINIARVICFIIAIVIILGIFGVNTAALVTSLGAITVVLGLALQDVLKDFISGIAFIFEDSYNVGDWVTINGFKGEVISLGTKTTRVRAYEGDVLIINNARITEVINHTSANSLAIVDVNVSYEEDISRVEKVLNELCLELKNKLTTLKGEIELLGIEKLDSSSVVFRITAEVESGSQYNVQREIRKQVKLKLDKNNITIPYNQLVVHNERV